MSDYDELSAAAARIQLAAIDAFAEGGYQGTSTRQITKRLNMSATAMYPHFRSKEELLFAIALDGHHGLLARMRGVDDPERTCTERIGAVVRAFVEWQAEYHKLAKVVQFELNGLTPPHFRTIARIRRQTSDIISDIVRKGQAAGEFEVDDPDDVVLAISSLCVDVCRWFPSRRHKDPRRLGDVYASLVERMVR